MFEKLTTDSIKVDNNAKKMVASPNQVTLTILKLQTTCSHLIPCVADWLRGHHRTKYHKHQQFTYKIRVYFTRS